MGVSEDVLEGTLFAVHLLGGTFCAVVFYHLFQTIRAVESRRRRRVVPETKLLCGRCIIPRLAFRLALSTVGFFLLHYVCGVADSIAYFCGCKDCVARTVFWFLFSAGVVFGYPLMFLTHFERMRLVFNDSVSALPKWTQKLAYSIFLIFFLAFIGFVVFRWSQPILSAACFAFAALIYLGSVTALIGVFFKRLMAVARYAGDQRPDIIQAVARVAIVMSVSLLSTTLTRAFWVVVYYTNCSECPLWLLIANTATAFDLSLNAFCLLCTFPSANTAYMCAFGWINTAFLRLIN